MKKKEFNKESGVKSILKDLKSGIDKKTIFGKIRKNSEIPNSTLYGWYSEAEKKYLEFKKKADPIIEAKEIEALGQIAVSNIMSKLERQILLSEIAKGERLVWKDANSINGVVRLESYDPAKYIDLLNKMDGVYVTKEDIDEEANDLNITITEI